MDKIIRRVLKNESIHSYINNAIDWDDCLYWDTIFKDRRPTEEQVKQFFIEEFGLSLFDKSDICKIYITEAENKIKEENETTKS